jgi:hypothetical protein
VRTLTTLRERKVKLGLSSEITTVGFINPVASVPVSLAATSR